MKKLDLFNQIVEQIFKEKDIDSFSKVVVEKLTTIFNADRATFYFFNEETEELWSYVSTDLEISEIRVPLSMGVVGRACLEKKVLNVKNAYKLDYFDRGIDEKTGYHTKTILCSPLLGREGRLLGAIQVINKRNGLFTEYDEKLFTSISFYTAVFLENIRLLKERDIMASEHSRQAAYLLAKIAKELRYSGEDINISL